MAKYIMDVSFDIPQEVLKEIPSSDPTSVIKSDFLLERLDKAPDSSEFSSVRVNFEGSDSWCQKQARKLTMTIKTSKGPQVFKARGYEIVHCQS